LECIFNGTLSKALVLLKVGKVLHEEQAVKPRLCHKSYVFGKPNSGTITLSFKIQTYLIGTLIRQHLTQMNLLKIICRQKRKVN
jgi:hypothetical protein